MGERPIKVLNILPDGRLAGPAVRVLSVSPLLRERGIETTVVLPVGEDEVLGECEKRGISAKVLRFSRPRNTKNPLIHSLWALGLFKDVQNLGSLMRKEGVDIAHCNGLVQLAGGFAGRMAGIRVLWHLNDLMVPGMVRVLCRPIVIRLSDSIVFASGAVEEYFGNPGGCMGGGILPAPVDTHVFNPAESEDARGRIRYELSISADSYLVGMVGNVNYLKGVGDFVAAARIISSLHANVHFVHVGARLETRAGLYQEVRRSVDKLGLSGRFVFAGRRNDVRDMLAAMDAYVIPSLSEACPISLLEAMSMAKPIVATDVGGIPELVRDGREGLLVPPRSPAAIAGKVALYLENPEWARQMGRLARKRAVSHFDVTRCVDLHEKYYRELLVN